MDAVAIANARSFVESSTLEHQISDEPAELLANMKNEDYKSDVIAQIGQETYDYQVDILDKLAKKKEKEGVIENVENLIDQRTA